MFGVICVKLNGAIMFLLVVVVCGLPKLKLSLLGGVHELSLQAIKVISPAIE